MTRFRYEYGRCMAELGKHAIQAEMDAREGYANTYHNQSVVSSALYCSLVRSNYCSECFQYAVSPVKPMGQCVISLGRTNVGRGSGEYCSACINHSQIQYYRSYRCYRSYRRLGQVNVMVFLTAYSLPGVSGLLRISTTVVTDCNFLGLQALRPPATQALDVSQLQKIPVWARTCSLQRNSCAPDSVTIRRALGGCGDDWVEFFFSQPECFWA